MLQIILGMSPEFLSLGTTDICGQLQLGCRVLSRVSWEIHRSVHGLHLLDVRSSPCPSYDNQKQLQLSPEL